VQQRIESELIADGRNGDRQALSELFERHYRSSVRAARRILHSDEEALDAVQSAYLAAFQHFGSFRGEASFNTWITRIVKNQCLMYLRRPERRVWAKLEEEGGGVDSRNRRRCPGCHRNAPEVLTRRICPLLCFWFLCQRGG